MRCPVLEGSTTTDSLGAVLEQHGSFPFGEPWYDGSDKWKFTSYERDAESGNDYARMRFGVNRLGRFSSPDPMAGSIANPQSLNHYAYSGNDPVNLSDPSGMTPRMYVCSSFDPIQIMGCSPWGSDHGGGGGGCTLNGIYSPCGMVQSLLSSGGADQCPANLCEFVSNGAFYRFQGFADGTSGYIRTNAPPGWSFGDFSNALSTISKATSGTQADPSKLSGRAKKTYDLLIQLGVKASDITIYQTGSESFSAVLTTAGFDALRAAKVNFGFWDAALHYPYTDGGRDDNSTDSLHFVWFDPTLTNSVGGNGVYMDFHYDNYNPSNGGFWGHWACDVFRLCH